MSELKKCSKHGYYEDICLGCLETAAPDLLAALKELHTREGVTAVGPHNTGSRPDICYVCAALAKAEPS